MNWETHAMIYTTGNPTMKIPTFSPMKAMAIALRIRNAMPM